VPATMYDAPFYIGSAKLKDMVALITGGDSGIGKSVAALFAREGADIAIVHLDEDEDAAQTAAAVEKEGGRCLVIKGDVKEPAFCRDAVERTVAEFEKLDVLVNNSASQVHTYDIADLTEDHFNETLKTNLYGYFHMARAAVPHLRNGSAIINTGSVTGFDGEKTLLDHSMTKGGIHAFTKSLASQLIPERHPCQLRFARPCLVDAQSERQGAGRGYRIRLRHADEAPGHGPQNEKD